jgi:hypothetical protein
MATTAKMQKKSLDSSPDETRTFEKGKIDLANFSGDVTQQYRLYYYDKFLALLLCRYHFIYKQKVLII